MPKIFARQAAKNEEMLSLWKEFLSLHPSQRELKMVMESLFGHAWVLATKKPAEMLLDYDSPTSRIGFYAAKKIATCLKEFREKACEVAFEQPDCSAPDILDIMEKMESVSKGFVLNFLKKFPSHNPGLIAIIKKIGSCTQRREVEIVANYISSNIKKGITEGLINEALFEIMGLVGIKHQADFFRFIKGNKPSRKLILEIAESDNSSASDLGWEEYAELEFSEREMIRLLKGKRKLEAARMILKKGQNLQYWIYALEAAPKILGENLEEILLKDFENGQIMLLMTLTKDTRTIRLLAQKISLEKAEKSQLAKIISFPLLSMETRAEAAKKLIGLEPDKEQLEALRGFYAEIESRDNLSTVFSLSLKLQRREEITRKLVQMYK